MTPVVLDNVDDIYRDRDAIRRLKSLCQTDPVKQVSWLTATPILRLKLINEEFKELSDALAAGDLPEIADLPAGLGEEASRP